MGHAGVERLADALADGGFIRAAKKIQIDAAEGRQAVAIFALEHIRGLYPGETYSPYAERYFPTMVYWGETHLHTALSLDAGLFGNVLGHEEAYRLARGEQVTASSGLPVKLSRPLDWLVITDHSDMMGFAPDVQAGKPHILAEAKGREWHEGFKQGGQAAATAAFDVITNFAQFTLPEWMLEAYNPGSTV